MHIPRNDAAIVSDDTMNTGKNHLQLTKQKRTPLSSNSGVRSADDNQFDLVCNDVEKCRHQKKHGFSPSTIIKESSPRVNPPVGLRWAEQERHK